MAANEQWKSIGDMEEVLGKLYIAVDGLEGSTTSEFRKIADKLDLWIASNQRLLEMIVQNSQEVSRSTRSYEQGMQLLTQLQQQLESLQKSTTALSENLEFLPPAGAGAAVANSQPTIDPVSQAQLQALHDGMNQAIRNLQSLQTLFAKSVEEQIKALGEWSQQNEGILPQKPIAPARTWKDNLSPITLGLGAAGAIGCVAFGVWMALQLPQVSEAQSDQARWANTEEGLLARDLMRWNNHKLIGLQCMEDVKRLKVTLEVDGRPASSGFCTLWVEPPERRTFEAEAENTADDRS